MNNFTDNVQSASGSGIEEVVEILDILDALQPSDQQKKQMIFSEAYPGILRAIARKMQQKDIISALNKSGLKLHPNRYREMLDEERKRRAGEGERICCKVCGSDLQHARPADGTTRSNSAGPTADMEKVGDQVSGETA